LQLNNIENRSNQYDIAIDSGAELQIQAAIDSPDDVRIKADDGSLVDAPITAGNVRAADDVKIKARGNIEVAGAVEAFDRIELSARNDLTLLSQASLTGLDDGKARFVYLHAGDELNLDGFINAERIVVC